MAGGLQAAEAGQRLVVWSQASRKVSWIQAPPGILIMLIILIILFGRLPRHAEGGSPEAWIFLIISVILIIVINLTNLNNLNN